MANTTLAHETVVKRPVGTTATVASLLVVLANLLGLHLDATTAAAIIGALALVVSTVTPRTHLD